MPSKTTLRWLGDMAFEANVNGFKLTIDADTKFGGQDKGPRPKPLLLAALSGCSAMDVVSMLEKMKLGTFHFDMDMEADMANDYPQIYKAIRMIYKLEGENLPVDKVVKAITLSKEKYCGVYAMLSKASTINISLFINGKEVWHD